MSKRTAGVLLFMILTFLACTQIFTLDGVPAPVGDGQRGGVSSPALVFGG